ncbi:MAG: PhoH family protein [Planctomycetaceae bacterium]|nr:PhoH family protein [Planctomycetaceae bacterium]
MSLQTDSIDAISGNVRKEERPRYAREKEPGMISNRNSNRERPSSSRSSGRAPSFDTSSAADTPLTSLNEELVSSSRVLQELRRGRDKVGKVRPKTDGQRRYMEAIEDHPLVFCEGPAGCGKTYLAVAMALEALRREEVRKIILVRPAVEAGEKLGFLPGDMFAKVNPYLRPLLDAINDMLEFDQVRRYMSNDVIEIAPLAFMRGRTLNDTFIILDEGQNTTITQMKMFLTRMGINSRIIVTGDSSQNDLPKGTRSGLSDGMQRLAHVDGVAIIRMTGQDIVRHRLVREIVSAYETEGHSPQGE